MVVLIDEKSSRDIDEVAEDLKSAGLTIRRTLRRARTVVGSAESEAVERLRSVEGVALVRPEGRVQLPPMDEKIPQ